MIRVMILVDSGESGESSESGGKNDSISDCVNYGECTECDAVRSCMCDDT